MYHAENVKGAPFVYISAASNSRSLLGRFFYQSQTLTNEKQQGSCDVTCVKALSSFGCTSRLLQHASASFVTFGGSIFSCSTRSCHCMSKIARLHFLSCTSSFRPCLQYSLLPPLVLSYCEHFQCIFWYTSRVLVLHLS